MNKENLRNKDVKVWLMEMPADTMQKRALSWADVDCKAVELLEQKNVRLTKKSPAVLFCGAFFALKKSFTCGFLPEFSSSRGKKWLTGTAACLWAGVCGQHIQFPFPGTSVLWHRKRRLH